LQDINGGGIFVAIGVAASVIAVANAVYKFYRGYRDASKGRYDP